eukprot:scaffold72140_cov64-Phaeocystis_antarctica.AAC.3
MPSTSVPSARACSARSASWRALVSQCACCASASGPSEMMHEHSHKDARSPNARSTAAPTAASGARSSWSRPSSELLRGSRMSCRCSGSRTKVRSDSRASSGSARAASSAASASARHDCARQALTAPRQTRRPCSSSSGPAMLPCSLSHGASDSLSSAKDALQPRSVSSSAQSHRSVQRTVSMMERVLHSASHTGQRTVDLGKWPRRLSRTCKEVGSKPITSLQQGAMMETVSSTSDSDSEREEALRASISPARPSEALCRRQKLRGGQTDRQFQGHTASRETANYLLYTERSGCTYTDILRL